MLCFEDEDIFGATVLIFPSSRTFVRDYARRFVKLQYLKKQLQLVTQICKKKLLTICEVILL